jgi:hypothetical protein
MYIHTGYPKMPHFAGVAYMTAWYEESLTPFFLMNDHFIETTFRHKPMTVSFA